MKYFIAFVLIFELVIGLLFLLRKEGNRIIPMFFIFYIIGVVLFFLRVPNGFFMFFLLKVIWYLALNFQLIILYKNKKIKGLYICILMLAIVYLGYGFNVKWLILFSPLCFYFLYSINKKNIEVDFVFLLLIIDTIRLSIDKIW
jgi:hypothetical protein